MRKNNCNNGSKLHCNAIMQNWRDVVMTEGHMPRKFTIGADNARKQPRHHYCMWFVIWLLCALSDTPQRCVALTNQS